MEKSALLNRLIDSVGTIYRISEKHSEYIALNEEIESVKKAADKMESPGSLILLGIILVVSFFVNIRLVINLGIDNYSALSIILPLLLSLVEVCIISFSWFSHTEKKARRYKESLLPELEKRLENAAKQLYELVNSSDMQRILEVIPEDYATYDAVSFFIVAIKNNRADTLKEAINLYEDELHKRKIESMHEQEISLSEQQLALQNILLSTQQESTKIQQEILKKNTKISNQLRFSNAIGVMNTVKLWGGRVKTK